MFCKVMYCSQRLLTSCKTGGMIKVIFASSIFGSVDEEVAKPAYQGDGFCVELGDSKLVHSYGCARKPNHNFIRFSLRFKCRTQTNLLISVSYVLIAKCFQCCNQN